MVIRVKRLQRIVCPSIDTGAANDFVSIIYTEISCVSGGREGPIIDYNMTLDSRSLKEMLYQVLSDETSQKGMQFQTRPSDVIICSPLKCGMTWMQQITHQLRTGGDMQFDVIDDVVPWIELAYDKQRDLQAE